MFSGFVTLDSEKRVFPLLPADPFVREQPIVGLWIYGAQDLQCPYLWAACARFVFCRNFKDGSSKMASNFPSSFLLVNFKPTGSVQFLSLQVHGDPQWSILTPTPLKIPRNIDNSFSSLMFEDCFLQPATTVSAFLHPKKVEE